MKTEGLSDFLLNDSSPGERVDYIPKFNGMLFNRSSEVRNNLKAISRAKGVWESDNPASAQIAEGLARSTEIASVKQIFRDHGIPEWMADWADHEVDSSDSKEQGWGELAKVFLVLEPGMKINELTRGFSCERLRLLLPWHHDKVIEAANRMSDAISEQNHSEANKVLQDVAAFRVNTARSGKQTRAACNLITDSWRKPYEQALLARHMKAASGSAPYSDAKILARTGTRIRRGSARFQP